MKNKTVLISVLMPAYNAEKYIGKAIKSILNQTITNFELIITDDGSTDKTGQIIQDFAQQDSRIVIISRENKGLVYSLNESIKQANGEYIARMDADDISLANRFECQLAVFTDADVDVCGSWISEFDVDEEHLTAYRKVPEAHNEIVKFAKRRNPLNHPSVMYKKSVVQKFGSYQNIMFFEDYDFWVRLIVAGAKFYNIQTPLVKMHAGKSQLTRRSGWKYVLAEFALQKRFLKIGFINYFEFLSNIFLRVSPRIMPKWLLGFVYKIIRRH
ncbi:MAG: glycosyltransferase [Candidatus Thioglobus sp.]|nr:MAG: glycosyltransferase [Candidatus Thioglobus sp.]